MSRAALSPLEELARLLGIQTRYTDATRVRRKVPAATVVRLARLLGAPIDRASQAAEAVRAVVAGRCRQVAEPVTAAWLDAPAEFLLRLSGTDPDRRGQVTLVGESLERQSWPLESLEVLGQHAAEADGAWFTEFRLRLPAVDQAGYYRLIVERGGTRQESLLIVAPSRMFGAGSQAGRKRWGLFLPLYAVHSQRSLGAGNYSDLAELATWAAGQGASFVATLPLLASRVDHWDGISPYAPISRLFWNELFIDLERLLAETGSPELRSRLVTGDVAARVEQLRRGTQVDYPAQAGLQRELLSLAAEEFFRCDHPLRREFETYLNEHGELLDYARFRAVWRAHDRSWHTWPEAQSGGRLAEADADPSAVRLEAWIQWQATRQLAEAAERIGRAGATCYLDLPLGVHGDGYDVWRFRRLFARGAAGGAPPDSFFTQGQNWGFPPLHPGELRTNEYRYWRSVLRHHLRHARLLRIDHVMGLHRLFWIPDGLPTAEGAYVQYPAGELYAILALESHRARAELVGENLGTVPPAVNRAMKRHGLRPTYVVQFSLRTDPRRAVPRAPREAMAGLNTHDMPTWAAFWQGLDIEDRRQLGLIDTDEAQAHQDQRGRQRAVLVEFLVAGGLLAPGQTEANSVLAALLAHLEATPVDLRLVSLEDLWLETEPQNVPGTLHERPNWRRKARLSLEAIQASPEVARLLALCRGKESGPQTRARAADGQPPAVRPTAKPSPAA